MSTVTIAAALQGMFKGISGIKTSDTRMRGDLTRASLPLVWTYPEDGRWTELTQGSSVTNIRQYATQVFVAPVAAGASIDEGYQKVLPLMDAMGVFFRDNVIVTGTNGIILGLIADSGVVVLVKNGVEYHGFEFRYGVREDLVAT